MQIADHVIALQAGYSRHGLYAGENNVIYLDNTFPRTVMVGSLDEFCQAQDCIIRGYPFRPYSRELCLQRAYQQLQRHPHELAFRNDEQFVEWCIKGDMQSETDEIDFQQALLEPVAKWVIYRIVRKAIDIYQRTPPTMPTGHAANVIPIVIGTIALGYGVKKLLDKRQHTD